MLVGGISILGIAVLMQSQAEKNATFVLLNALLLKTAKNLAISSVTKTASFEEEKDLNHLPSLSVVSFFSDRTRADTNALAGKELNNIGEALQHDFVYDKICKLELLIPSGVVFSMKREE